MIICSEHGCLSRTQTYTAPLRSWWPLIMEMNAEGNIWLSVMSLSFSSYLIQKKIYLHKFSSFYLSVYIFRAQIRLLNTRFLWGAHLVKNQNLRVNLLHPVDSQLWSVSEISVLLRPSCVIELVLLQNSELVLLFHYSVGLKVLCLKYRVLFLGE